MNSHSLEKSPPLYRFFVAVLVFGLLPHVAVAQWQATVGAQSNDIAKEALAFLPNELWIHAGDSVTWTTATDEPHTVTFLANGQTRPPFAVGCPGFSPSGSMFDGSACVDTPPLAPGPDLYRAVPDSRKLQAGLPVSREHDRNRSCP